MSSANYPNSYYAASRNLPLHYPTLQQHQSCDICIVGAGFTGISTALFLAEKKYSVVVLEAQRIGWGASGRNGGQVTGDYDGGIEQLSRYVDRSQLQQFWDIAEEGKDIIRKRIEQYRIQCDISPGVFLAALTSKHLDMLRLRQQQAEHFGYCDYQWIDNHNVGNIVANDRYIGGLLDQGAFHLHPLNLLLGQAKAATDLGVKIYENSAVTQLTQGQCTTVSTSLGQISCRQVVVCGEGYLALSNALQQISSTIFPVSTYMLATRPLDETTAKQLLPQNSAVSDCRHYLDFYRLSADRRLLFGGGSGYGGCDPNNIIAKRKPALIKNFPELRNIDIDYCWSGVMGFTDNTKPHFNRIGNSLYIAQGFSSHGVALSHVAGKIVAECLANDTERFDLFSRIKHRPLPRSRWFGRAAVALISALLQLRDALRV